MFGLSWSIAYASYPLREGLAEKAVVAGNPADDMGEKVASSINYHVVCLLLFGYSYHIYFGFTCAPQKALMDFWTVQSANPIMGRRLLNYLLQIFESLRLMRILQ